MLNRILTIIVVIACISVSYADPVEVSHWDFQVVNEDGSSAYIGTEEVLLEGVVLNSPEEWLDPTANFDTIPWNIGGQWEIFVQGMDGDHAGTAVWIGQNYANVNQGNYNYTDQEWKDELCRVNRDPNTGYIFHPGDKVQVIGKHLFYKGKRNVNENHHTEIEYDFQIHLIEPAYGLPIPEAITLSDIKNASDDPIFDASRETGCEYYQARLVRIKDVTIQDPENFGQDSSITITDGAGRTFPVVLCRGAGLAQYDCPVGTIDVIGIFDQKAPSFTELTTGYRLLVLNYDGNGQVLTHRGYRRGGNQSGDLNSDYRINLFDLAQMAAGWLDCVEGLGCE